MAKVTELLKGRAEVIEQKPIVRGYASTNRPAPTGFPNGSENLLWVIVPGYSLERPLGPCKWAALWGSTLPKQGTPVLVAFDEENFPVVVWWEGQRPASGVVTLVAGTKVVSCPSVTSSSKIFLTVQGGTLTNVGSPYVSARTPGTSFTIKSTNASDTSEVAWSIGG